LVLHCVAGVGVVGGVVVCVDVDGDVGVVDVDDVGGVAGSGVVIACVCYVDDGVVDDDGVVVVDVDGMYDSIVVVIVGCWLLVVYDVVVAVVTVVGVVVVVVCIVVDRIIVVCVVICVVAVSVVDVGIDGV